MITCLAVGFAALYGCSGDVSRVVGLDERAIESSGAAVEAVSDLTVSVVSESSVTTRWSAVGDGTRGSASYRVEYSVPPLEWAKGSLGCDLASPSAPSGEPLSCTVDALDAGTTYDFQLMSYRTSTSGVITSAAYSNVVTITTPSSPSPPPASAGRISDLSVSATTGSSLTLRWTQVDDGTGQPASYQVRSSAPPIGWSDATIGCGPELSGTAIGTAMSCTVDGLLPATDYEVVVAAFGEVDGAWQGTSYSNVARGRTAVATQSTPVRAGIWIDPAELAALPMSGAPWSTVVDEANSACGVVDLTDQEQTNNVCILAKALVFARTGDASYRSEVIGAIREIVSSGTYAGRALSLGRELGAYVVAADLVDLPGLDPSLDQGFRGKLRELLNTYTSGAASSLVDCHERRPNNWGAMCGASRAAVAVYLGDSGELARVAQVFKGFLGDRSSYAGFTFGELSWQCDPSRPVAINPSGCQRYGHDLDGVIPDDQRRAGPYSSWPPPKENYVWESLQGIVLQAAILQRAGYPTFEWEDQAVLRAVRWLHSQADFPAVGDDAWVPHVVNYFYGTSFPAPPATRPGKNMGWTDWTHAP
jgi:hypothetical protein